MPELKERTALLDEFLDGLAERSKERGVRFKHDASGIPIAVGYSHGPGGLLTFPGVDNMVFHTIMGNMGIMGQLATIPSLFTNPTYYTITGVRAATGDEKTNVCDDAPIAGLKKACLTTAPFGRYERQTAELELNRLGQRVDRADPMDLAMVGSPIHGSGLFATGPGDPAVPADIFRNEVTQKFWEMSIAIHRLLSQQLWVGTPANNSAGGGYKELTSFSILVNTGHVDAETGTTCPSLDSYLRDFNFQRIDAAGDNLVEALTDQYYQVKDRAIRTGVMPVRWVFAMRPQLFYELTAVWACSYLTYRCQVQGNERVVINAEDQIRYRDEMRAGKYLLIDVEKIPVVEDDGIDELTATENGNVTEGCFATDIYLIPMSVGGGRSVTFLEYFQYSNPSLTDALGRMILGTVQGAFLTWPRQTNQCVVWQTKIEPRLVLRTPWLAARLQNVMYCPVQHIRDTFPAEPYHVDGGKVSRPGPSYFSLWQN